MRYLQKTGLILMILLTLFSCKKKEEDKSFNVLTINSGADAGFTYVFSPNMGFWSYSTQTVKYVHLVFGDVDNNTVNGKDIMSVLFYNNGANSIAFPSPEGQHVNIGITVNGDEQYYTVEDAVLTVTELTDDHFKGTLSGTFISGGPEYNYVEMKMDIDIQLTQIL